MKIYDIPGFANPFRIRAVLAEKNLADQIQFVPVDLFAAEHKQEAFLGINPAGTVPVLELEDGLFLSECTAITEYLDNLDGAPTLTGRTAREKGVIHMMQKRAEVLLDSVGDYFHYATPGLGPNLEAFKSPSWTGRTEWGNRQREKALSSMIYFNDVLKTQPYVAGDDFSMADLTVLAALKLAGFAQVNMPDDCTALASWNTRMHERPSVAQPA
jgi:glutathione S-transferase